MKRIVLIRHGKAEHPEYMIADFDRGLTKRGFSDGELVASWMKPKVESNFAVISSPAKRAYQTAIEFLKVLNPDFPESKIQQEQTLYDGITTSEFLDMMSELPNDVDEVLIFGHNPTQSILAERLCPDFQGYLPTSALVAVEFGVENWTEVEARSGEVGYWITPKELKNAE